MKVSSKVLLSLLLSFSFIFTCIGYAALTDTLTIEGKAVADPPDFNEVVIIDVSVAEVSDGASHTQANLIPTNLQTTINYPSSGSYVTYKITVKNFSKTVKYSYDDITYLPEVENNSYYNSGFTVEVTSESGQPLLGTDVEPDTTMVFYAKYTLTNASLANTDISSLLCYNFGVHIDSAGDLVIDHAIGRFEQVLNDPTDIERLRDQMATNDHDYIGNVAGDDEAEDSALINDLFTTDEGLNQLKLTATNGEEKAVTCIIKEESLSINGENTPTMTIYMTADEITGRTGLSSSSNVSIEVYAAVYAQINGIWFQLGDMYRGTARTANYNGSWFSTCNSFNTDTWTSAAQSYPVLSNYTYVVDAEKTLAEVLSTQAPEDAWTIFSDLVAALNAINLDDYAINSNLEEEIYSMRSYADMLITQGRDAALLAELVPFMRDITNILNLFE